MNPIALRIATLCILLGSWASVARAVNPDVAPSTGTAAKPWKESLDASELSTNGNSKSTATSIKETFDYNWLRDALELVGGGLGASAGNQTTAEQYFANEKVTHNYTPDDYLYEKGGWDKDRFAGINSREIYTAGLGRILLNLAQDKLTLEFGGGYTEEERTDAPHNDFASGRAFTKYVHAFSATANFLQSVEYLHDFSDSNDFRINTETALSAAISSHVALKASFIWNRVNEPPPGAVKDDTKVMAGLQVTY